MGNYLNYTAIKELNLVDRKVRDGANKQWAKNREPDSNRNLIWLCQTKKEPQIQSVYIKREGTIVPIYIDKFIENIKTRGRITVSKKDKNNKWEIYSPVEGLLTIMNKKSFWVEACNEPILPRFDIAVIGAGQEGCAALHRYQSMPHSSYFVNNLCFCEEPCAEISGEIFKIIEKCPVLFCFMDLRDKNVQQAVHICMETHKKCHGKDRLSVCIAYQNQETLVDAELTDCISLIVFVDNRLDSLSLVTKTLLDDLSESGLVGIDMFDVFSVLRLCKTMHYFCRIGEDLTKICEIVNELKKDAEALPCTDSDTQQNGIVSIRADFSCGLEVVDQAVEALENGGCWVNQITFHSDESKRSICVSLLLGW